MDLLKELFDFARSHKNVVTSCVYLMALVGEFLVLAQGSAFAPFIYVTFTQDILHANIGHFMLLSR